jgi:hypothetical protein
MERGAVRWVNSPDRAPHSEGGLLRDHASWVRRCQGGVDEGWRL